MKCYCCQYVIVYCRRGSAADLRTRILDFGGFDSSISFISRSGIPRLEGNFLESMSRAILAGIISAGRLGVARLALPDHSILLYSIV